MKTNSGLSPNSLPGPEAGGRALAHHHHGQLAALGLRPREEVGQQEEGRRLAQLAAHRGRRRLVGVLEE